MVENRKIECPFCGAETINTFFTPSMKKETRQSFGRSHTKSVITYTKEKYEVINGCPECGAKLNDVQKKLNNPSEKPSRESVLERMRKSGLPTRI